MKPIRVALSGSGFKFPAHVGALKAIRDEGFAPVEYAGTSGGSIISALAASGMSVDAMEALTLSRDWSDMLTFSPWSLLTKIGYCTGDTLLGFLNDMTKGVAFKDLSVDLSIVASDIGGAKPYLFSKITTPYASVALAARASASIPFVYAPIQYGKAYLMDGGLVNNIPVDLLAAGYAPRIGIQLISKTSQLRTGVHGVLDIAPRVIGLMLSSNDETHVDLGCSQGARVAWVETVYVDGLDRNMSKSDRQRLMADGYAAAKKLLETVDPLVGYSS